jgi:hypothetical protein
VLHEVLPSAVSKINATAGEALGIALTEIDGLDSGAFSEVNNSRLFASLLIYRFQSRGSLRG